MDRIVHPTLHIPPKVSRGPELMARRKPEQHGQRRPRSSADRRRGERAATRRRTTRPSGRRRAARSRSARQRSTRSRSAGSYSRSAQSRLRRFRSGTILAVALTGLALLIWGGDLATAEEGSGAAEASPAGVVTPGSATGAENAAAGGQDPAGGEDGPGAEMPGQATDTQDLDPADPATSVEEATGTIRDLVIAFYGFLPKLLIALALLVLAALISRFARLILRRALGDWDRAEALAATAGILVWLMALGAALSVLAGDARALIGSVGLFGLALSWALQAPIESFAGWLVNSFRSYYRVGDRIEVGEVFGDVYRIDFLTTTVWEAGGPEKPVRGAQPTGAMITFPNSEVLRASLVNHTRDFPYVWDELEVAITNESDLPYAIEVITGIATDLVGKPMEGAAAEYRELLRRRGLGYDIGTAPQVFVSPGEAWTNLTVRYLVPARERRGWSSKLLLAITAELAKPEHGDRIQAAYPRADVRILDGEEEKKGTAPAG